MIIDGQEYILNNGRIGKAVKTDGGLFDIVSDNNTLFCSVDSNGFCSETNNRDLNKEYSVKFDDYETVIRDKLTGNIYSSIEDVVKGRKDNRIIEELNILLCYCCNNIDQFIEDLNSNEMKKEIMEYLNERVSS